MCVHSVDDDSVPVALLLCATIAALNVAFSNRASEMPMLFRSVVASVSRLPASIHLTSLPSSLSMRPRVGENGGFAGGLGGAVPSGIPGGIGGAVLSGIPSERMTSSNSATVIHLCGGGG